MDALKEQWRRSRAMSIWSRSRSSKRRTPRGNARLRRGIRGSRVTLYDGPHRDLLGCRGFIKPRNTVVCAQHAYEKNQAGPQGLSWTYIPTQHKWLKLKNQSLRSWPSSVKILAQIRPTCRMVVLFVRPGIWSIYASWAFFTTIP